MIRQVRNFAELCQCPAEERLPVWYKQTGGNMQRLQLLYVLASEIIKSEKEGYSYSCLKPEDIRIISTSPPKVAIVAPKYRWPSDGYPVDFADPLVMTYRAMDSSDSLCYSYAIVFFQLMTLCHPFHGQQYDEDDEAEQKRKTIKAEYDYIGDQHEANPNDIYDYDNTSSHLSPELDNIFKQFFTVGKLDSSARPSIFVLRDACLRAIRNTLVCKAKEGSPDYDGLRYHERNCPHCGQKHELPFELQTSWQILSGTDMLMPDNLSGSLRKVKSDLFTTGTMYLSNAVNKITQSILDPLFQRDDTTDPEFISIKVADNKIEIMNNSSISFYVDRTELKSGKTMAILYRSPIRMVYNLKELSGLSEKTDAVYGDFKAVGMIEIKR